MTRCDRRLGIASFVTNVVESSHEAEPRRCTAPSSTSPIPTPDPTPLFTHGSTRSPRRRCRLGRCAHPPDAPISGRESTELVGHRLPAPAQHAADHLDARPRLDACLRPATGPVAAAAPRRRRPPLQHHRQAALHGGTPPTRPAGRPASARRGARRSVGRVRTAAPPDPHGRRPLDPRADIRARRTNVLFLLLVTRRAPCSSRPRRRRPCCCTPSPCRSSPSVATSICWPNCANVSGLRRGSIEELLGAYTRVGELSRRVGRAGRRAPLLR